jgi:hypothetical protein
MGEVFSRVAIIGILLPDITAITDPYHTLVLTT